MLLILDRLALDAVNWYVAFFIDISGFGFEDVNICLTDRYR